jgi:hypothetical protein
MIGTLTNLVELLWDLTRERPIRDDTVVMRQNRVNSSPAVLASRRSSSILSATKPTRLPLQFKQGGAGCHFWTAVGLDTAAQADGIATVFSAMARISSSCQDSLLARVLPNRIKS